MMAPCSTCGNELVSVGSGEACISCQQRIPLIRNPALTIRALRYTPTTIIIAINVVVFLLMVAQGVSFTSPSNYHALIWGADFGPLTLTGQFWRLLASNYIHFGFVHLALNMWCLWGLGRLAEAFYAPADYVLLYTFTGLCSSLLSVAWKPLEISAGASGAVFGIAGVMLTTLQFGKLPITAESKERIFKGVLQFSALNLFIGSIQAHVDNAGHIGGLVSGLVVGGVLARHLDSSNASRGYRRTAWLLMALGFILALALVLVKYGVLRIHIS